jgi:hypothetical protein
MKNKEQHVGAKKQMVQIRVNCMEMIGIKGYNSGETFGTHSA